MAKARPNVECGGGHKWQRIAFERSATRYRCSQCGTVGLRTTAEHADNLPITPIDAPHYYELRNVRDDRACVYFLAADSLGMVKIGTTRNLEQRLMDIRISCPVPIRVVYQRPGGHRMETEFHRRFAAQWSHGEWFRMEGELRDFLDVMTKEAETRSAAEMQRRR